MGKKHGKKGSSRPGRSKKRKFTGNQHTSESDTSFTSTSAQKVGGSGEDVFDIHCSNTSNYCLLQFSLVFMTLQNLLKCKKCGSDVEFSKYGQRALGFKLCVTCTCGSTYINSCPMIGNAFEINRRFVYIMRLIGVGLQGINIFCGLMDMGHFNSKTYYQVINHISIAVKSVFEATLCKAVNEEKSLNKGAGFTENELSVSGDGSWAKRGFSSLLGIVSLIGKFSNKILDVVVKSSFYKACDMRKHEKDSIEFQAWYSTHKDECNANHEGGAGKMEVDGVIEMFKRSEENYNVKYANYIGDGDMKTFRTLINAFPYGNEFEVKKLECVLHVKKRMFKRLSEAKKKLTQLNKVMKKTSSTSSSKRTSKKKTGKKAQLTINLMKDLSTYYGLTIRRYPDSVEDMKNAVWATYYHKISTDETPHSLCPEGADSWCNWRKNEAAGTLDSFHHPPALDEEVQSTVKEIYEDLSSDDLLRRCLGSNTQNNNESFNACVWNFTPKHIFCGK